MSASRTLERSFAGGEVTPEFWSRIDDAKYQSGLATCRNFIVKPQGPVMNRPGTTYVSEVKDSTQATRLIPFTYSTTQTMAIELGAGYFRFHTLAATLLAGALTAYLAAATVTISIASPGVITWNAHGMAVGTPVQFSTTGALPTGLTAATTYYVLNPTTNTFQLAATAGGTAINTSGTQSGVHTGNRVYSQGDLVLSGGSNYYCIATSVGNAPPNATYWYAMPANGNYEIPNGYAAADLFDIHFVQSADVLTLVHPNYAPMELRRKGATNWQLTPISFVSAQVAPAGVAAVATGGTGTTYKYVVTAVGSMNADQSSPSASASCNGNVFATGAYNTITWSASPGASRYFVYKLQGGLYGYIGQTDQLTFSDSNIAADMSQTPPINANPFPGAGDYPGAVSYFEQRRAFAGTINKPQNIWMTQSGTESNMNYSLPTLDSDSIQFRVAAREANTIRHIVPLTDLVLLTSAAEWRVRSINSDAITPSSFGVAPQSYVGASNVPPAIINNNVLYCAARGGHVREMAYNWQAGGYITGDLSLRAPHLFDSFSIVDMCYVKAPIPIVWAVSSSGKLLGLTYIPEQQIGAWHQHDTDGVFESCCSVAEGQEDVVYTIVRRTINGVSKRYVECVHTRVFATQSDAFFVDCGMTYSGAPATTISGLAWLEGKTVAVLGDGAVMPQQVVTGGAITLPQAVSKAQIGLPITADLYTLPVAIEIDGMGQGRAKNVNRIWLRVYQSSGVFVGPDAGHLTELKQRTTEAYGTPPGLVTDELEIVTSPSWGNSGQMFVRQANPLPLTITGISLEVTLGG